MAVAPGLFCVSAVIPLSLRPSPSRMPLPPRSSHVFMKIPWLRRLVQQVRPYGPAPVPIDGRERLRFVLGVMVGLLVTGLLSRWWGPQDGQIAWMVASVGASAVLVFGMPSSPLAQPWPVVAGSTLAALVAAACQAVLPDPAVAGAVAVGLAIALMVPLRCLHPPGGGVALFVVYASGNGWELAVFPVLFNVVVLVVVATVYNRLTGRVYPHPQRRGEERGAAAGSTFAASDVDAALAHYNQVLDVSRSDLEGLLRVAGRAAFQRTLGELRCADIMSKPPLAVEAAVSLQDAWALMRAQQIKALPVVDDDRRVIGIVGVADFLRLANLDVHEGIGTRLRALFLGRRGQPKIVEELMVSPVQVGSAQQHAMDLVPLFSHQGHHHLPIVDESQRLVGVITQTDLVRTLAGALHGREGQG
jgi:CBS domain-containing membrane protein